MILALACHELLEHCVRSISIRSGCFERLEHQSIQHDLTLNGVLMETETDHVSHLAQPVHRMDTPIIRTMQPFVVLRGPSWSFVVLRGPSWLV
jgi:hypothetical protein